MSDVPAPLLMSIVILGLTRLADAAPAGAAASAAIAPAAASAATAADVVHPMAWPVVERAFKPDPDTEAFVDRLLDNMTMEEKIGQLVQADIESITPEDLRTYHLGSILAGGNAAPGGNVRAPASSWLDLTDRFFRASVADASVTGGSADGPPARHPPIPIIFGIDAVHGDARIPGATIFPHNVGLGATHDMALVEEVERVTAAEVAATGVDWTFAPTVAVVRDVRWGRSYESYSEDPALVAAYGRAAITGLQGHLGTPDFLAPGHVLASVKHFLGDGATVAGRDQFDSRVSEHELREVHSAGYPAAISAGALIVMASYNGWHGVKMHANRPLLTDVLKGRWNFSGFVVGDWNAHEEVPGCTKYSCAQVFNAGVDMYMAPDSWRRLYANLVEQVRTGQISRGRLDDAVRRILRVKVLAHVFEKRPPKERPEAAQLLHIGDAAHRAVALKAVRESLVLLKNNGHVLPLDPHSRIFVTGPGADDIGMQCGGWTIDWQGAHNTNADFPGGTSILDGIRAVVAAAGGTVITGGLQAIGTGGVDAIGAAKPAAAIVVYGEKPYAEFEGDRETLEFSPADNSVVKALQRLRAAGIPVISVFLSGRPLWVNRELNASDAFVAAWLPGSEGAGVADLLFKPARGGKQRDFTGRLAFSWPATAMPVSFDAAGSVHGALFSRGFGLSLTQHHELGSLSEDPQVPPSLREPGSLFHAGHVTAPWSIYLSDPTAQVRLTMQSQASPEGNVTAELMEPTVRVVWSGHGDGNFWIGGRAGNYHTLAPENEAISLHYRIEAPPSRPVDMSVRCEAPYGAPAPSGTGSPVDWGHCGAAAGARLDLTAVFRSAAPGTWQTLTVPLSCFEETGAVLDNVSASFALETSGRLDVSFDEIRLGRQGGALGCPPKGAPSAFTAQRKAKTTQAVSASSTRAWKR